MGKPLTATPEVPLKGPLMPPLPHSDPLSASNPFRTPLSFPHEPPQGPPKFLKAPIPSDPPPAFIQTLSAPLTPPKTLRLPPTTP